MVNGWWNRLIAAVYSGSLSDETERYASHSTKRDYVWNSVGLAAWGFIFPILTIVASQTVGAEQAGLFSMAFVIGNLLLFIGNYGVRTYQISDIDEEHSFYDYQINRIITSVIMLVVGIAWCRIRGYDETMTLICMGVFVYRMIDGLADVYEGRLQQFDKLYLAGVSQTLRSVLVILAFSLVVFVTRNLVLASIAMAIASLASFVLLTLPLALFETPKSREFSPRELGIIFKDCFPLFTALFLYALIDNMPKLVMEGTLTYDNQLYFNAMYFPAHAIVMLAGIVYKPQLVRLAALWSEPDEHRRFNIIVLAMFGFIAGITLVIGLVIAWVGIPVMSVLYGIDFERFRTLTYVMVVTGGVSAAIDFLYQIITVFREQGSVTRLYLIAFVFAVPISFLLINYSELSGAVVDNLVIMAMLFVLLVTEYFTIKKRLDT
ncbi:MAG: lipopolysaccharide biosynthesis protein [Atopobiaceae bacterium]|nr:lipopolysaccharide biosynthesis protein [Atopobiaceae bacterium]